MKCRTATLALFAAWTLVACSCGSKGAAPTEAATAPDEEESSESGGDAPAAPIEKRDIDSAQTGTVRGRVTFDGEADEPVVLSNIPKQPGCQHGHETAPISEFMIVNDGGLQNAFVRVKKGLEAWNVPAAPDEPVVLEQLGCVYRPHVQGLQVGQTLLIRNSDPTNHNVNCGSQRQPFNINQGPGVADHEVDFTNREVIRFKCDIHPWMSSWVGVEEHPFFAVSAADGSFEIAGLPPGSYEIEAVHENTKIGKRGKVTGTVEVAAGRTAELTLTFED